MIWNSYLFIGDLTLLLNTVEAIWRLVVLLWRTRRPVEMADIVMQQVSQEPTQAATFSSAAVAAQASMMEGVAAGRAEGDVLAPNFPPVSAQQQGPAMANQAEYRRVRVPANRYTPLRDNWEHMMTPIVKHMKLQIRMNTRNRCVELKTSPATVDPDAIQKAADFVKAFLLGFDLQDAIALLRIDDLYVDSFQVEDVKMLHGDHLSRAIGRVAGQDGKTKFAIENATRTRIVLAGNKVHILGSFTNIKIARNAVCALIMGSPPGKVYNRMRGVASRMNERL